MCVCVEEKVNVVDYTKHKLNKECHLAISFSYPNFNSMSVAYKFLILIELGYKRGYTSMAYMLMTTSAMYRRLRAASALSCQIIIKSKK